MFNLKYLKNKNKINYAIKIPVIIPFLKIFFVNKYICIKHFKFQILK